MSGYRMSYDNIFAEAAPGHTRPVTGDLTTSGLGRRANGCDDDSRASRDQEVAIRTPDPESSGLLSALGHTEMDDQGMRELWAVKSTLDKHLGECMILRELVLNKLEAQTKLQWATAGGVISILLLIIGYLLPKVLHI